MNDVACLVTAVAWRFMARGSSCAPAGTGAVCHCHSGARLSHFLSTCVFNGDQCRCLRNIVSVVALAKSEQDLQKEVRAARARLAELGNADPRRLGYRTWLAERAEAGDWDAVVELRRQQFEAEKARRPGDQAIVLFGIRLKVQIAKPPDHLTYRVHCNGALSIYGTNGTEILRDTGSAVYVMQMDDDSLELCLRMSQKNWGNGNFTLFGDAAFIERAIQVATERRLNVIFSDDEQNAMLQHAKARLAR